MRIVPTFVLLLLVAPAARADDAKAPEDVTPAIARSAAVETPLAPALRLEEARPEQRSAAEVTAAQDMPQRGSFWWLVAVVVVAGVILAVLL